jgi:hypothetical protein
MSCLLQGVHTVGVACLLAAVEVGAHTLMSKDSYAVRTV